MKKIIKKILKGIGIAIVCLAVLVILVNKKIDKEIEPLVNKEFTNLKWEMDYDYPSYLGSAVESRFKNTTGYGIELKIGYKLKESDGTILEEGTTETIHFNPGEKRKIEISFGYSNVSVDDIEFNLLNY